MPAVRAARRPRSAWFAGVLVLTALLGAVTWLVVDELQVAARLERPAPPAPVPAAAAPAPPLQGLSQVDPRPSGPTVRGIVRLPGGEPAQGATVAVERAVTSWPEWQTEPLELARAITGADGAFQFRVDDTAGLLVRFDHPQLAGGLADVPPRGDALDLRLEPAFELYGYVTTATGAPRCASSPATRRTSRSRSRRSSSATSGSSTSRSSARRSRRCAAASSARRRRRRSATRWCSSCR
jgi:hypothetical protein